MARACLRGPGHLLFCGPGSSGQEGSGMELAAPCWPRLPAAPRLCPRRPQSCSCSSRRQEPRYTNDYLSLGALPGILRQGGAQGAELLLCSRTSSASCCSLHSPQGNQTLWLFWSFVVKLFPNSNRFKCHHTNGREKPFMQLKVVF